MTSERALALPQAASIVVWPSPRRSVSSTPRRVHDARSGNEKLHRKTFASTRNSSSFAPSGCSNVRFKSLHLRHDTASDTLTCATQSRPCGYQIARPAPRAEFPQMRSFFIRISALSCFSHAKNLCNTLAGIWMRAETIPFRRISCAGPRVHADAESFITFLSACRNFRNAKEAGISDFIRDRSAARLKIIITYYVSTILKQITILQSSLPSASESWCDLTSFEGMLYY